MPTYVDAAGKVRHALRLSYRVGGLVPLPERWGCGHLFGSVLEGDRLRALRVRLVPDHQPFEFWVRLKGRTEACAVRTDRAHMIILSVPVGLTEHEAAACLQRLCELTGRRDLRPLSRAPSDLSTRAVAVGSVCSGAVS